LGRAARSRAEAHVTWSAERSRQQPNRGGVGRGGWRGRIRRYPTTEEEEKRGGGRVLGAAMAMATAPEPMGVAEGKLAMALVPIDAARQRLGGENELRALITSG